MKSLRGFAAIGVILHHISQEMIFQNGKVLTPFVNAGAFFVAIFAVSAGLWQDNVRRDVSMKLEKKKKQKSEEEEETKPGKLHCPQWIKTHYLLIPTALCFFAALATLSRAAILLSFSILGFWFIYLCLSLFTCRKNLTRVKLHFGMLVGIVLTVVLVVIFAPDNFVKEISTVSPTAVADRVTGTALVKGENLDVAALRAAVEEAGYKVTD